MAGFDNGSEAVEVTEEAVEEEDDDEELVVDGVGCNEAGEEWWP